MDCKDNVKYLLAKFFSIFGSKLFDTELLFVRKYLFKLYQINDGLSVIS